MTITNNADKIQGQFINSEVKGNTFIFNTLAPDDRAPLQDYLKNYILQQCSSLPLNALAPDERQREPLRLQAVYVNLDCNKSQQMKDTYLTTNAALAHMIDSPRLVILGQPGGGKSTLLRFIATCLAEAWLNPEREALKLLKWKYKRESEFSNSVEVAWPHGDYLPLFFILRDVAPMLQQPPTKETLWEFMQQTLKAAELAEAIEPIKRLLLKGQVLLLFDGVDEVERGKRAWLWQAIGLMQGLFPLCPWVTTCRVLAFEAETARGAQVSRIITLSPFKPDQIAAFITHWYDELVKVGERTLPQAQADSRHLIKLTKDKQLLTLAENPMLLTIMVLVHSYDGTLPKEEAKLYKRCIESMVVRWQQHKEKSGQTGELLSLAKLGITTEQIMTILQELAWRAHTKQNAGLKSKDLDSVVAEESKSLDLPAVADLTHEEVRAVVKGSFPSLAGGRPDELKIAHFMEYTETRAHVLVSRGNDTYTFPHRKFQEFLAARYLTSLEEWGLEAILLAEQGDAWREVLFLAVGDLLYNNESSTKLSRDLIENLADLLCGGTSLNLKSGHESHWWRVVLIGQLLNFIGLERIKANKRALLLLTETRQALIQLIEQGELTSHGRVQAAWVLGELGDSRRGVGLDEHGVIQFDWVEIPAGNFIMGSNISSREQPIHEVTLYKYYASRYLVTNLQFQSFIEHGGYQQRAYWTEAGWEWKEKQKRTEPTEWHDPRFNQPNQPVVGVSWYEAMAFCAWANNLTPNPSLKLGEGKMKIRLPTEAEWEKAARGTDGRKYPWGNEESTADHANYHDSIGATSAVGCYPRGATDLGLLDMAGNVREWCLSEYKPYPYKTDDGREDLLSNNHKCMRGGSWELETDNLLRCACRNFVDPNFDLFSFGFRCFFVPIF